MNRLGCRTPRVASADFYSVLGDEIRIVEVKGRGSSGPVSIIERQLVGESAGVNGDCRPRSNTTASTLLATPN